MMPPVGAAPVAINPVADDAASWDHESGKFWLDPEPMPGALPAVDALDAQLLPEALRVWVMDISDRIQCPPDYPAIGALVTVASIIGRQVGIRPKRRDDWLVVPNLWGAIIGRPGALKTPALMEPMRQLDRLEILAREDHERNIAEFKAGELVRRAEKKELLAAIREAGGDERVRLARQAVAGDGVAEPIRRRYRTSDTTMEKLGELLRDNPRGLLVFRDELTGWLSALDREGREGSRAFFLESWNGTGRFIFDRIGRGTVEIEAACVSILGGIQPGPLSEYLAGVRRGGGGDDGLLQRFQLLVWPDASPEWHNVDEWPDNAARQTAREAMDRLNNIDTEAIGARQDESDIVSSIRFAGAAQEFFDAWRSKLETRLRTGDLAPAFEAHIAKYRSLMPSLALIFHLLDAPAGGPVSKAATARAAAMCQYLESHARRLYSPALDPALAAARELDRHMLQGDVPSQFTARDIYQHHWHRLDKDGAQLALDYLATLGRVRSFKVETGGRPTTRWEANPALMGAR